MTKPFVPEFTDRLGALAYIHDGRGGKLERPTKDSWNTKVVQPKGKDEVTLFLGGNPLITWWWDASATAEMVTIDAVPSDFTARKRMNDYLLQPRGLEIVSDNAILGIVGSATGNHGQQRVVPGRVGVLVAPTTLDASNVFGTIAPASTRWSKKELKEQSKAWAKEAYADLLANEFSEGDWEPPCFECSAITMAAAHPLTYYTHNFEHLFAHAYGFEFNLGLFINLLRTNSSMLNLVAVGPLKAYGKIREQDSLEEYLAERMYQVLENASMYTS